MMFWFLSKLFWLVAQLPAFIGLLILVGLLLTLGKRKRSGQVLIAAGLAVLFVFGFTSVGTLLIQPLEARYARPAEFPADAAGIIALGGGTLDTVSAARGAYELYVGGDRYVEAVRLALAHPDVPVLLTGGVGNLAGLDGGDSDASSAARLFDAFGIPRSRLILEQASRNTYENAVNSAALLRPKPGQRYVLITSAYHMARSVALFRAAGFDVVPWPVDYLSTGKADLAVTPVYAADSLLKSNVAIREWIGLFAYWAVGRIPSPWP